jgi:hypothetical protein
MVKPTVWNSYMQKLADYGAKFDLNKEAVLVLEINVFRCGLRVISNLSGSSALL